MKNTTTAYGTFEIIKRLPNTRNGNPRYLCSIIDEAGTGYTFKTIPNDMQSYIIQKYDGKRCKVALGQYRDSLHGYNIVLLDALSYLSDNPYGLTNGAPRAFPGGS